MKKILTLLIAAGALTSVQAQVSKEEARRVILGGGNDNSNYPSGGDRDVILGGGGNDNRSYPTYPRSTSNSSRQSQIDQVNREYDVKIQSIRNNPHLSNQEKQRSINQLERDRQRRIQQINSSYNNGNYDRNDDRSYSNNGKHKGWDKKPKNKNWKKGHQNRHDD